MSRPLRPLLRLPESAAEPPVPAPSSRISSGVHSLQLRCAAVLVASCTEHRLLIVLVSGYVLLGGALLTLTARPYPLGLTYPFFAAMWLAGSTGYAFLAGVRNPRDLPAVIAPSRVIGAFLVGALTVPFQITFQSLKLSIGYFLGFRWDAPLSWVDRALHGGPAWHWTAPLAAMPWLMKVTVPIYQAGWTCVVFGFLVWLAWSRHRTLRMRALVATVLVWSVGGTLLAAALASAGPCFSTEPWYTPLTARFDAAHLAIGEVQRGHWAAQQAQVWSSYAGVSAFPSMHVAISVLMAIVVWARARPAGIAMWLFAIFIQAWSVLLGWHYAIDGYAGALCAWGAWVAAGRLMAAFPGGIADDEVRRAAGSDLVPVPGVEPAAAGLA
jgi:PAP2 superfamily protein